jgi:UPF0755 protein
MKRLTQWMLALAVVPAALGIGGWQALAWWNSASAPAVSPETANAQTTNVQPLAVEIPDGTSATEVGDILKKAGLIRSTDAWAWWTRIQGWKNREGGFQAGSYAIAPTESLEAIAEKIWTGKIAERSFTIPEGWSATQMADYFEKQGFFSKAEFVAAAQQVPRDRYPWIPEGTANLEGYLFPDTYALPLAGQVQAQDIVNQMLDRFQEVALPIYQQAQGKTPYSLQQWVILSSIVEREAVVQSERPQIASVFAKRLRENIPLGSDPTVEYGLGIRQTADQPLTFSQVETPTPYNTYMNAGLTPTPISSPGLSSLQASVNPADTEYLYFVARYDGTHVFSKTLAEHEGAQTNIHDKRDAQKQQGQTPAQTLPTTVPPAQSASP